MTPKEEFICPKCKKKNRIKFVSEVSSVDTYKVINKDLFHYVCKNCGERIFLDHNLIVTGDNYKIYYTPGVNSDILDNDFEIERVCDTFDDLKEKLLMFNDGLFDITVEFIKMFLEEHLKNEGTTGFRFLRYDGRNEDVLYFYLDGLDKSVSCPVEFYEKMYKKLKYKKINKAILIDRYTFRKYYRMRLF